MNPTAVVWFLITVFYSHVVEKTALVVVTQQRKDKGRPSNCLVKVQLSTAVILSPGSSEWCQSLGSHYCVTYAEDRRLGCSPANSNREMIVQAPVFSLHPAFFPFTIFQAFTKKTTKGILQQLSLSRLVCVQCHTHQEWFITSTASAAHSWFRRFNYGSAFVSSHFGFWPWSFGAEGLD